MNEEKYGYIYITTINDVNSKLNNHYYIGQHKCNEFDENYYGSGNILINYIKKNGKNNLICEIIEWAYNKEQLNELEKFYVNEEIINDELCMNLCIGGEGGDKFNKFSDEELNKFRQKMHNIGKELFNDELYRKKVIAGRYIAARRQWDNEETRNKTIKGIKNAFKDGKIAKKISTIMKEKYNSYEWKQKWSIIIKETIKNRKWYNNGELQAFIKKEDVPEGWVEGRLRTRIPKEWKYYNNGVFQVRWKEKPEGFKRGKLSTSKINMNKSNNNEKLINEINYKKFNKKNRNKKKVI